MRLPVVALLLCLSMPAWAGQASSLAPYDDARLRTLEMRMGGLDADHRELRAYADKSAKSEADGVKDILVHVEWSGGLIVTLLLLIYGLGAWRAADKARQVAESEMRKMEGRLEIAMTSLMDRLTAKEQEALAALQAK
ncbi:MAG: hypothetical protein HY055_02405, partial [Magnetospirillum sp.]|nr:hypothetical protein [Magnetospirillum sp.]